VGVKKRYFQVTEDLLRAHPELLDPALPSINARLQAVAAALPELAAAAALKAIAEWGRPASDITHLVVSTSSGAQMPGVDVRIASLLGLRPTVRRTMIYFQACTGGAAALRVAKDAAENNRGARVLAVCADALSAMAFHAPDEARPEGSLAHAIFGDGAGAVVVGADPRHPAERPAFEMVSASQFTIPGTERLVTGDLGAAGVGYSLAAPEVTALVGENIERVLAAAVEPFGVRV
jgi:predicted naringenin-chalcone synthase